MSQVKCPDCGGLYSENYGKKIKSSLEVFMFTIKHGEHYSYIV